MAFLAVGWLACTVVAWAIGNEKGRALDGFLWGLFFGVIGVVIAIAMKPASYFENAKTCPHCAESIKAEAKVCKHCGRDIDVAAA